MKIEECRVGRHLIAGSVPVFSKVRGALIGNSKENALDVHIVAAAFIAHQRDEGGPLSVIEVQLHHELPSCGLPASFSTMKLGLAVLCVLLGSVALVACSKKTDEAGSDPTKSNSVRVCTSDGECDDSIFCNGSELCEPDSPNADPSGCVRSAAPCLGSQSCDENEAICQTICEVGTDVDGDGHDALECGGDDCDDSDANRYPGNLEVCDAEGHDEDCDPRTYGFRDIDSDGSPDAGCCNGDNCGTDCDDQSTLFGPLATELCDGADNDCDGEVDEDVLATSWYPDCDGDLFGNESLEPILGCRAPTDVPESCGDDQLRARWSDIVGDCDDQNLLNRPVAEELCDGVDNDCDGEVDDNVQDYTWYPDCDGDGFGRSSDSPLLNCNVPSGLPQVCADAPAARWVTNDADCDDADSSVWPAAPQICDPSGDNSCNTAPNPFDSDGDGSDRAACGGSDCNDNDSSMYPGAEDVCDGVDKDCDGYTEDADGDGSLPIGATCTGSNAPKTDCDDTNPLSFEGATEICDGGDNNCDGEADEQPVASEYCDALDGVSTAVCSLGRCQVTTCPSGSDDCDGTAANGCEVNTRVEISHCGACGSSCNLQCSNGRCDVAADIAMGEGHTCVIVRPQNSTQEGTVFCWGENDKGSLGIGSVGQHQSKPQSIGFKAHLITAGRDHTCATDYGHRVYCWGSNQFAQVGGLASGNESAPVRVVMAADSSTQLGAVVELAAGSFQTCAIRDDGGTHNGEVYCWGWGTAGRLGNGASVTQNYPVAVVNGSDVPITGMSQIAVGIAHACALRESDGRVFCWGDRAYGQLGDNQFTDTRNYSARVRGVGGTGSLEGASAVYAGGNISCALLGTDLYCWGEFQDNFGEANAASPRKVLEDVVHADMDNRHICAVRSSGEVWCWRTANGSSELLGRGSVPGDLLQPAATFSGFVDSPATRVTTGFDATCAVREDGAVYCWGDNTEGTLGDGTLVKKNIPTRVAQPAQ